MSVKHVLFFLGCAVSWLIALPIFVIGGGIALFTYAVLAELGDFVRGNSGEAEDIDARERARLMCLGH
jgi:hypothetical protein